MGVNYKCYGSATALLFMATMVTQVHTQARIELLGVKLGPEVTAIVREIETKTGRKLYADLVTQPDFQLGASFIDDDGRAVVVVDPGLAREANKLEAVITHELLHLRLTVNNYPAFIFSPTVRTAKGLAIDVEQSNINDLRSVIEHRVFKAEMERFGLYKFIDLAGDTAAIAKNRKGQEDGQDDAINYARAILEYQQTADISQVEKIYKSNGWTRSLAEGRAIADIIRQTRIVSPKEVETVFLRCLDKLYPSPGARFTFALSIDPGNKHFRRMVISLRRARKK